MVCKNNSALKTAMESIETLGGQKLSLSKVSVTEQRDSARSYIQAVYDLYHPSRYQPTRSLDVKGKKFSVQSCSYYELPLELVDDFWSDNGNGTEYANYIRIEMPGLPVLYASDAIESEDKTFSRELLWIKTSTEVAYLHGQNLANESKIDLFPGMDIVENDRESVLRLLDTSTDMAWDAFKKQSDPYNGRNQDEILPSPLIDALRQAKRNGKNDVKDIYGIVDNIVSKEDRNNMRLFLMKNNLSLLKVWNESYLWKEK